MLPPPPVGLRVLLTAVWGAFQTITWIAKTKIELPRKDPQQYLFLRAPKRKKELPPRDPLRRYLLTSRESPNQMGTTGDPSRFTVSLALGPDGPPRSRIRLRAEGRAAEWAASLRATDLARGRAACGGRRRLVERSPDRRVNPSYSGPQIDRIARCPIHKRFYYFSLLFNDRGVSVVPGCLPTHRTWVGS